MSTYTSTVSSGQTVSGLKVGAGTSLTLFGQYTAAGFHLAKDGAGTAITYSGTISAHVEMIAGHA